MPTSINFKKGVVLLIDKPMDWTSFDVVNKLRFSVKHKLQVKKIKVGHAGTLDPMATGLLILCIGKYTKCIEQLTGMDKCYKTSIKLGASTPSYDAESEEDGQYPTEHINEALIEQALESYRGPIEQLPPMFSAIKIKGQALYKLARKGITIERKTRPVTIHRCDLVKYEDPSLDLDIECTKGTYIRSLGHDIGKSLDSGGYLTALRRTSIGQYKVDGALQIPEAAEWINNVELIPDEL